MGEVYIVSGSTGEYSDFRMWHVRAFITEAAAKEFCDRLNEWCVAHGAGPTEESIGYLRRMEIQGPGDLDPQFALDYTGTTYEVWGIEVEGLSDAFIENMGDDR